MQTVTVSRQPRKPLQQAGTGSASGQPEGKVVLDRDEELVPSPVWGKLQEGMLRGRSCA